MSLKEGHSTTRPPFFEGSNFAYWKSRMEYYLKTEVDMWFSVTEGFTEPTDENGKVLESSRWSPDQKWKSQANAKAVVTLQCGLSSEQLIKVGPFRSAKELWDKLIELNEGTKDSRVAKRDLLINQMQNFMMKEGETVSQLHGRFKELLNGLHAIGERLENRDLIRYALKSFPRDTLWSSMVDAYKVSRDLSTVKLDELFCELELHEQANASHKEKGIALVAGEKSKKKEKKKERKEETSSDSSCGSDSDEESSSSEMANFVRKIMRRSRRFNKNDVKKMLTDKNKRGEFHDNSKFKTDVVCYECHKKGHVRNDCPKLKKQEEKLKKKKKALKATWDDSSSSSSEEEIEKKTKHMALMAVSNVDSSESERSQDEDSSSESSSSDDEVTSPKLEKLYATIACLTNALSKSKSKIKRLQNELKMIDHENTSSCDYCLHHDSSHTSMHELENENAALRMQVDDLRKALEKFTSSSKYLDMILGAQRAVYNKAGLGYKPKQKEVNFMSLTSRHNISKVKTVQAWVPKQYVIDATGPKIWVPKHLVHRV
ncbi:uncharacterized protein LOC141813795 [Curcuma longa]|uniref:uncharacterized protein LOC141813795 n=1 Tax=Curcuma longa TaxID=136217 RepID=UPI003D9EBAAF